jgi:hypothetical protein
MPRFSYDKDFAWISWLTWLIEDVETIPFSNLDQDQGFARKVSCDYTAAVTYAELLILMIEYVRIEKCGTIPIRLC